MMAAQSSDGGQVAHRPSSARRRYRASPLQRAWRRKWGAYWSNVAKEIAAERRAKG